jgi:anti-anti-sigma factor
VTVGVVERPDDRSVRVRVAGDVDMVAKPVLAETVDRLRGLPVRSIVVDVTAVTFACSTLAHFLDAIHTAHPEAALTLHQPSPLIQLIVKVAGLDRIIAMTGELDSYRISQFGHR